MVVFQRKRNHKKNTINEHELFSLYWIRNNEIVLLSAVEKKIIRQTVRELLENIYEIVWYQ